MLHFYIIIVIEGKKSIMEKNETKYYIFAKERIWGPEKKDKIFEFLQNGHLNPLDFFWDVKKKKWRILSNIPGFEEFVANIPDVEPNLDGGRYKQMDILKARLQSSDGVQGLESIDERRYPRKDYTVKLIIHNNLRYWNAESRMISQGGALIHCEKLNLKTGSYITVHFNPGDIKYPFNCVAQIVNKPYANKDLYGIKFEDINEQAVEFIGKYLKSALNKVDRSV